MSIIGVGVSQFVNECRIGIIDKPYEIWLIHGGIVIYQFQFVISIIQIFRRYNKRSGDDSLIVIHRLGTRYEVAVSAI